ncbi:MAG: PqiC family protein [Burkholderiales bacterium]
MHGGLRPAALFVAGVLLALGGCGSSPVTHFYTLSPAAAPAPAAAQASPTVAIGAVQLPDGLDRPQIVLRGAGNQVSFSEFERWLGSLKDEIALAVAAGLKQSLGGASVYAYPMSASVSADVSVLLHVQRFDSVLGEAATVEVLWQVVPAKGAARKGQSSVREPVSGPGYEALVAAHGRALAAVSRDVAAAISAAPAR